MCSCRSALVTSLFTTHTIALALHTTYLESCQGCNSTPGVPSLIA